MSFTRSTTDVRVHRNMPDYPTGAGISASDLKTAFDSEAEGLQDDLNRSLIELEDTTAAASLGAAALVEGDTSSGNVQAKLEYLQGELQDIALGDIPDGTITQAKMNETYEGTLAKKDGNLQTGLNSEKLNSKTEAQLKSAFLGTPNPSTLSFSAQSAPGSNGTTTTTETKTYSSGGSRYYAITTNLDSMYAHKFILYDAKSNKFIFTIGSNDLDPIVNSSNILVYSKQAPQISANSKIELTAAYSSGTLTVNATKTSYKSGSTSYSTPALTLTIFEMGGIV